MIRKCLNCQFSTIPRGVSQKKAEYLVWCTKHQENWKDTQICSSYKPDGLDW